MEWLNYHHLLYFWTVAREGGIRPASEVLHLAHPTLSGQIRTLEGSLGEKLFARQGRRLVLTETGRVAYRYADEIFSLGREMLDTLRGRPTGRPARLVVGVADAVPKLVVRKLLAPALAGDPLRLVCREDRHDRLLADLATHALELVIADGPVPPGARIRAHHELLGQSGISFFAAPDRARSLRRGFPRSLTGAPMLLPIAGAPLRRAIDQWLDERHVRPTVVGEFEDSALMEAFGSRGAGVFPAPTVVAADVERQLAVTTVGEAPGVQERFYAISMERRFRNPAVAAICDAARAGLTLASRTRTVRDSRRRANRPRSPRS
ncbi:MAG: transcriptional activator NhaR [Acidobacteriota bacterium]